MTINEKRISLLVLASILIITGMYYSGTPKERSMVISSASVAMSFPCSVILNILECHEAVIYHECILSNSKKLICQDKLDKFKSSQKHNKELYEQKIEKNKNEKNKAFQKIKHPSLVDILNNLFNKISLNYLLLLSSITALIMSVAIIYAMEKDR